MNLRTITDENELNDFSQGYNETKQSKSSMNNNAPLSRDLTKGTKNLHKKNI